MSHFCVAVIHREDQDVDELLAPYDESIRVAPYISRTKEEVIKYARENYPSFKDKTDEECYEYYSDGEETDEDGNIISTYNPNSKWDWYVVGGRWSNMLKAVGRETDENGNTIFTDRYVNEARISDIDFSPDPEEYARAIREWEVIVEGDEQKPRDDFFSLYKPEYYLRYYGTKEKYAETMASFTTYAVVTPNGLWHEKAKMGWFGMDNSTPEGNDDWNKNYKRRFIDKADPNWIMTIVDCHI